MTGRQQLRYWVAALVATVLLVWLLRTILLPFIAGLAVAYLLDPLTDRLEARRVPRGWAAVLVLLLFFLLLIALALLLVPVLQAQTVGFASRLPGYIDVARESLLPWAIDLAHRLGVDLQHDVRQALSQMTGSGLKLVGDILGKAWSGGVALFNLLSLLFVTPIVAFYLLRDYDRIVDKIDGWLPRAHAPTIRRLLRQIDDVMAGFIRGQGTVCLILGIFYGVGLSLAGLEFGLIIGLLSGFLSFVPFVGSTLGLVLSMLTALTQFLPQGDYLHIGIVAAIFLGGQALEGNVLTPRLLGGHLGLHPVWVIFALFAGGALMGFVGVLIAVPAAAAIGVLVRFGVEQYLASRLYLGAEDRGPGS